MVFIQEQSKSSNDTFSMTISQIIINQIIEPGINNIRTSEPQYENLQNTIRWI